jgi:hypothetical protein
MPSLRLYSTVTTQTQKSTPYPVTVTNWLAHRAASKLPALLGTGMTTPLPLPVVYQLQRNQIHNYGCSHPDRWFAFLGWKHMFLFYLSYSPLFWLQYNILQWKWGIHVEHTVGTLAVPLQQNYCSLNCTGCEIFTTLNHFKDPSCSLVL